MDSRKGQILVDIYKKYNSCSLNNYLNYLHKLSNYTVQNLWSQTFIIQCRNTAKNVIC